ncbi:hypothetical protein [Streptomyces torulosus]|uniref:hypothetical protein n=1 Tax=Streptomyces torulosus TaxID=68276 RepID=UPI0012FF3668|nr:hypothetical protein [Streptomyces torulosus]
MRDLLSYAVSGARRRKSYRKGRRLPIGRATAGVITTQQPREANRQLTRALNQPA